METPDTATDVLETVIFTDVIEKQLLENSKKNLTDESIDYLIKQVKYN